MSLDIILVTMRVYGFDIRWAMLIQQTELARKKVSGYGHIQIHIRDTVSNFLVGPVIVIDNLKCHLGDFIFTFPVGDQC